MKHDKRITQQDIDEAKVILPRLFGLEPRHWYPGFLAVFLIIALFAVSILPGLRQFGTVYSIKTFPTGSAVFIDGKYLGSAPGSWFIPAGTTELTVSKPGFTPVQQTLAVGGRIFGTLFFPKKLTVSISLGTDNPEKILEDAFSLHSDFGNSGPASSVYQLPAVLSDALLDIYSAGKKVLDEPDGRIEFIQSSIAASGSAQSMRDALRSMFLVSSGGSPGPLGLLSFMSDASKAVEGKPSIALLVRNLSTASSQEALQTSTALSALAARSASISAEKPGLPDKPAGTLAIQDINFALFPATSAVIEGISPSGPSLPYSIHEEAFGLSSTETSRSQWLAFIAENPAWSRSNTEKLQAEGLVDFGYMDWAEQGTMNSPATGISWYAAQAYCEWLSRKAPAGYSVSLPSESQWEMAALSSKPDLKQAILRAPSRSGPTAVNTSTEAPFFIKHLAGNVWEWCSTPFFPYPAFSRSITQWSGTEKVVKGGSWANDPASFTLKSRGGLAATTCNPFLGFRPVLVRK